MKLKLNLYLAIYLTVLVLTFLFCIAAIDSVAAHGQAISNRPTTSAHVSGTYMNQVYAWAAGRQVTIRQQGSVMWVEVAGADEFGTGPTTEAAAKNFMESVDLMEHELNVPKHLGSK